MVDPIFIETHSPEKNRERPRSPSFTNEDISFYLEFQDKLLSERYKFFKIGSTSISTIFLLGLILSILFIFYWTLVFKVKSNVTSMITFSISLIFGPLVLWILIAFRFLVPIEKQKKKYLVLFTVFETFTILGWAVAIYSIILFRIFEGKCALINLCNVWSCNPGYSLHAFPADTSYLFISLPLMFSTTMPFIDSKLLIVIHLACALALIILIIEQNAFLSGPFIILFIIVNSLILVFYRYQNMEVFLLNSKYERSLEIRSLENRINEEKLSNEMSNMVASIAHDLKSVINY